MAERYDREYQATPLFTNLAASGESTADTLLKAYIPTLDTIIAVEPERHERSLRIQAALTSAARSIDAVNTELVAAGIDPIVSIDMASFEQHLSAARESAPPVDNPEEESARQNVLEVIGRLSLEGSEPLVIQTSDQRNIGSPQGFPKKSYRIERVSLVENDGVYDLAEHKWEAEMWRAIYKPSTTVIHTYFDKELLMQAPVRSVATGEAIFSVKKHGELKNSSWRMVNRRLKELEDNVRTRTRIQPVRDFLSDQALHYRYSTAARQVTAETTVRLSNGHGVRLESYADSREELPYGVQAMTFDPFEYDRNIFVRFDKLKVSNLVHSSADTSLLDELNDALSKMQGSDARV